MKHAYAITTRARPERSRARLGRATGVMGLGSSLSLKLCQSLGQQGVVDLFSGGGQVPATPRSLQQIDDRFHGQPAS